jgi:hypothetical protein
MVDVLFSQKCRSVADEFDAKTPVCPSIRFQMPLKVRSMLYFKHMFKRSRGDDRWCPS